MKSRHEIFEEICNDLISTYEAKNNDYGDSSNKTFKKFGYVAYATRMNDKMNRFEQLCVFNKERKVEDEKAYDTLLDLASYSIQCAIELKLGEENE